ncbi:hypothetical protein JAAARDRAFT_195973 [Jaapia argillacea MUCL 33604]|uniref:HCP-like protein n=1 Tax=Jaapia argillacea MUCL 33604 TaxID=933084 RepID=A0A067PUZ4_9AGAM|nr:hypothetical protein JAAARDRAFT_195973 [Jaapia argillacea MUCL 33604]
MKRHMHRWLLVVGLALLAVVCCNAQPRDEQRHPLESSASVSSTPAPSTLSNAYQHQGGSGDHETPNDHPQESVDHMAEAQKSYRLALHILNQLTSLPPSSLSSLPSSPSLFFPSSSSSSQNSHSPYQNKIWNAILPNPQGPGPLASALRILMKLRVQGERLVGRVRALGLGGGGSGGGKRGKGEEELRGRAVKVVDLLEHAGELGYVEAWWVLGQISLVPPTPHFTQNPRLAYTSYLKHAQATGSPTSQSLLAFFHASGYQDVVPIDQARALLWYTFAGVGGETGVAAPAAGSGVSGSDEGGHEESGHDGGAKDASGKEEGAGKEEPPTQRQETRKGDKGAQMALGWKYWAGVGVEEVCGRALEWYEAAGEQAFAAFLAPNLPLHMTLPLTHTKLSDLVGGVYETDWFTFRCLPTFHACVLLSLSGPGASVASTGLNAQRPAIRAAAARMAGEGWEDVLEYYIFNADRGETDFAYRLGKIFYQGSLYASYGGIASSGEGVGALPRDFARARYYFLRIARQIWPKDPINPLTYSPSKDRDATNHAKDGGEDGPVGYAAAAAGYLGRMYLRGEGVGRDVGVAKMWFERGAEFGDKECHNALGVMWRDGLIPGGDGREGGKGRVDEKRALIHFDVAAGQELAEAQVNRGKYHYFRNELKLAQTYFETALRNGSPLEAYYYLALIHASQYRLYLAHSKTTGVGGGAGAGSCAIAVSFYKVVAERGVWSQDEINKAAFGVRAGKGGRAVWDVDWNGDLVREAEDAWNSGTERGKDVAILKWWVAAERGVEVAQNNLAFVLDQGTVFSSALPSYLTFNFGFLDTSLLRGTPLSPTSNTTARLALTQYTRSAAQHNVDALVKVGDYYYHGLGVADEHLEGGEKEKERKRWEKAAGYYQAAAQTQMSALAMWNLGWMYENGVGVPQDFHLAKRYYDLALETNSEAYLPVLISLVKLYARSIWHTLGGGTGGLNLLQYDEYEGPGGRQGGENREIAAGSGDDQGQRQDNGGSHEEYTLNEDVVAQEFEEDGGPWYMGKAREEFDRRRRGDGQAQRREEDPVQWARERRNAEAERDSDFGPEDYFEGALRGGHRGEEEVDEFGETFLLAFLCVLVSVLIYYRGRYVERLRREEQERARQQGVPPPPQPDLGLFPPPGDPARDDWAILR